MLRLFIDDAQQYLSNPEHVIAVHCKAGKGRTGLFVATYLLKCGAATTPQKAILNFGETRTFDGKGLTIPSQMRYVFYWHRWSQGFSAAPKTFDLQYVNTVTVPQYYKHMEWNFEIFMWKQEEPNSIKWKMVKVFDYAEKNEGEGLEVDAANESAHFDCRKFGMKLRGDVRFIFSCGEITKKEGKPDKKAKRKPVFRFWFHTAFVDKNYLCFNKDTIDKQKTGGFFKSEKAGAKKISDEFKLELFIVRQQDEPELGLVAHGDEDAMVLEGQHDDEIADDDDDDEEG
jgi:hypothetical protein